MEFAHNKCSISVATMVGFLVAASVFCSAPMDPMQMPGQLKIPQAELQRGPGRVEEPICALTEADGHLGDLVASVQRGTML